MTSRKPDEQSTATATGAETTEAPHTGSAFGPTYWLLNTIEMFERLAYFGIRALVPIYIMQATEPGGLHLTAMHKGWIYAWWAILQSWLPMFTGGIADRYGYKRVLAGAISLNVVGYLIMAYLHSYYGFFFGILVLATGTAFFKPALQGSIAQKLTKENSSMGWGIFYWVVNIGAALAPIIATLVLGRPHSAQGWQNLFLVSAGYTGCNLLLLLILKDVPSGADKSQSLARVFAVTIENIWPYWLVGGSFVPKRVAAGLAVSLAGLVLIVVKPVQALGDHQWIPGVVLLLGGMVLVAWLRGGKFTWQLRLPAFLGIMTCFWMMMYQLWDLHPNFIEDWIDSEAITKYVPLESWREYGDRGLLRVPQQIILTFYNAFLIIVLVIPISYVVRKMRTLSAMLMGMGMATAGVLIAGLTSGGWILLAGITCFSFGEMLTGPKKNQYLGLIAPPGKKGLYLGYVNIPVGIGIAVGSLIAGVVYDNYGEKAGLALKELASKPALMARAARSVDWSDSLEKIPALLDIERDQAFALAQADLGVDQATAATMLRDSFRNDQGQIQNLALQYVARHADFRDELVSGLMERAEELSKKPDTALEAFAKRAGSPLDSDAARAELDRTGVGGIVHLLPDLIGKKRVVAFDIVRDQLLNKDLPRDQRKDDAEIVALLWEEFGNDPQVLNNLALEYLAQATPRMQEAVENLKYKHSPEDLAERVEEIEKRIGVGRTKSFVALSAARGAEDAAVDEALSRLDMPAATAQERVSVYLLSQPHLRFLAVARKDWTRDETLLQALIGPDENAREIVLAGIDHQTWSEAAWSGFTSIFAGSDDEGQAAADGINYHKLADKQDLIQKALDVKDWSKTPHLAAQVMGLNPFEARALAAAEVNKSPLTTTQLLWDDYDPQYKVWIPFAAIGVLAAVALAIFGQMAKRWADMNA